MKMGGGGLDTYQEYFFIYFLQILMEGNMRNSEVFEFSPCRF